MLEKLKWESLKKRRRDSRPILLYKGLKGAASIPTDIIPPSPHPPNSSPTIRHIAFQAPTARTEIYKGSFFPETIRDWNALPDSIITSVEDAEVGVARFTSLVRAQT